VKSDIKTATLKALKCPICGGSVNRYQPIKFERGKVTVLAECWSGDINREKPRHLYAVILKVKSVKRSISVFEVTEKEEEEKKNEQ
jgi:hypothetical protein